MEAEKLQRLHDTLSKLAPRGRVGGLGLGGLGSKAPSSRDASLPNNPLYNYFVRAGHAGKGHKRTFDVPEEEDKEVESDEEKPRHVKKDKKAKKDKKVKKDRKEKKAKKEKKVKNNGKKSEGEEEELEAAELPDEPSSSPEETMEKEVGPKRKKSKHSKDAALEERVVETCAGNDLTGDRDEAALREKKQRKKDRKRSQAEVEEVEAIVAEALPAVSGDGEEDEGKEKKKKSKKNKKET